MCIGSKGLKFITFFTHGQELLTPLVLTFRLFSPHYTGLLVSTTRVRLFHIIDSLHIDDGAVKSIKHSLPCIRIQLPKSIVTFL